MIFLARSWAVILASTLAPLTTGAPTFTPSPAPTRSTSLKVTVSPTFPGSFSTLSLSPAATRYCLPPVLITAYMRHPLLRPYTAGKHRVHGGENQSFRCVARSKRRGRGSILKKPHL